MRKWKSALQNIEMAILSLSLMTMLLFVFIATVCRYMKIPWVLWSDELVRNLMIWIALLGSGTVAREGNHFAVDVLYNLFSDGIQRFFFAIIQLAYWAFGAFVVYYGVLVCMRVRGMNQLSPGLQIPMWILYLCIPLCGLSVGVQSSFYYIPLITGKKKYSMDSVISNPQTGEKEGE